jgi:hypothetical protein
MIEAPFYHQYWVITGFDYIYNGRQSKSASIVAAGSHIKHPHRYHHRNKELPSHRASSHPS